MDTIIKSLPSEALLLEPRMVFDSCLVGLTNNPKDHWTRKEKLLVAVYDTDRTVEAIALWLDCSLEDALDWFYYNTANAWLGEWTPTFTETLGG